MTASTAAGGGSLYIIGELNHRGTPTEFYKIGIVRDSERNRTVDDRLADHQTGNPRELYVAHAAQSASVERVETLLHGQFATKRIGGEWFHLPNDTLAHVIATTTEHIAAANTHAPIADNAKQLASVISNGLVIEPTNEHLSIHSQQHDIRRQLAACKAAISHLTNELVEYQHATQPDRPWVHLEHKTARTTFDKTAFEASHPNLYANYLTTESTMTKTFRVNKPNDDNRPLNDINEHLSALCDTATHMNAATHDGETLHQHYLDVLAQQTILKWEDEQLDAQLRVACGANDGINAICTWKRQPTTRETFDVDALKHDQPDLYSQFIATSKPTIARNPVKDLRYRV